jgi:hypothetical protein
MNAHSAIKAVMEQANMISMSYLKDLSDDEILVRPVDGANHIAWQLGHLINSENQLVEMVCPGSMPALPEGFGEQHTKETAGLDDASAFGTKESYLGQFEAQRAGTLAALDKLSETDLDKPSPEAIQMIAPTVGGVFQMQATHWLMHAGQWAVIRRKLGRERLF